MKNLSLLAAIISLFAAHQSRAQAQSLKPPTWSLNCTPYPQTGEGPELILGIERLPPGNVAKATLAYGSRQWTLIGNIEDGHDHLVIHLSRMDGGLEPMDKMTVDLSYSSSVSRLDLSNGVQLRYSCATAGITN